MKTFVIVLLTSIMLGCGGEVEEQVDIVQPKDPVHTNTEPESYCGDYICDEDMGESYWNCIDCVDMLTGGPKNGYCGDGVCFNETMTSCWRDCRPRAVNSGSGFPWPGPGPGPDPGPIPGPIPEPIPGPIPGPDPGPFVGPGEKIWDKNMDFHRRLNQKEKLTSGGKQKKH